MAARRTDLGDSEPDDVGDAERPSEQAFDRALIDTLDHLVQKKGTAHCVVDDPVQHRAFDRRGEQ